MERQSDLRIGEVELELLIDNLEPGFYLLAVGPSEIAGRAWCLFLDLRQQLPKGLNPLDAKLLNRPKIGEQQELVFVVDRRRSQQCSLIYLNTKVLKLRLVSTPAVGRGCVRQNQRVPNEDDQHDEPYGARDTNRHPIETQT